MMPNISFGERVRRARIRNAMTQTELAKKFDVSQGTIFNWEKGNSIPSAEQKARLKKEIGRAHV